MAVPEKSDFKLRCKWSGGELYPLAGLERDKSTLGDLLDQLSCLTNISTSQMRIKLGYPPKLLDINGQSTSCPLSYFPIQNGDILIVEEIGGRISETPHNMTNLPVTTNRTISEISSQRLTGMLIRRSVPADNSCLFSSINFAMNDGAMEEDCVPSMRQLIAATVMSDPDTYTSAMLGRSNDSYCSWILDPESWGGAIELSILSRHYNTEMCVVSTQSATVQRFGEDAMYLKRIFLLYDGIHYDPLMLEPFEPSRGQIQTIFQSDDHIIMQQALEIAEESRSIGQYTDTSNFTLKCVECGVMLKGEMDAQKHALETKHTSYGEVR